jgi:glycosyltransferase involved in cell wall biosynthesis
LKRKYRCRWVADFRDSWFEEPLRPERQGSTVRRNIERFLARRLMPAIDATIAVSDFVGDEVAGLCPGVPAATIGYFAEAPAKATDLPGGEVHVVHTGSFALSDPRRRIEPVLEAFEAAANPKLRLHLVGRLSTDEIGRVHLSSLIDQITVTGAVPRETARSYQGAADVLLLVAVPDSQRVPGKIAEYQSAGRPVLAVGGGAWLDAFGLDRVDDLAAAFAALPDAMPPPAKPAQTPDSAARHLVEFLSRQP